jgi:predicted aldo/keto reductase-like oxidoreductase
LHIVDAIKPIAEAHGVSVARIALAWLLHQKAVMSVIIGAKSIAQLDDSLAATESSRRQKSYPHLKWPALSPANIHNGCSIASTAIGCQPRCVDATTINQVPSINPR